MPVTSSNSSSLQFPLARTWEELATLVSRPGDPLAVLQLINRISHRNWEMTIRFDARGKTWLHMTADPPLGMQDLGCLVDGVVAEVFRCDRIVFAGLAGQSASADVGQYLSAPPQTNLLQFSLTAEVFEPGLHLEGFWPPALSPRLRNERAITETLRASTWFGTAKYSQYRHQLEWRCLAERWQIRPEGRLTTELQRGTGPAFFRQATLNDSGEVLGRISMGTVEGLKAGRACHARFGEFDPTHVDSSFWTTLEPKGTSWLLELDESGLEMRCDRELMPFDKAQRLLRAVQDSVRAVASSDEFAQFDEQRSAARKEKAATALRSRQATAGRRAKVFWQGAELMCVPRAESEVAVLVGKLESLGALPLAQFKLREYTPKVGIDALADYQVNSGSQSVILGPVELEYSLENFFQHEHPQEQVGMILCWQVEDPADGRLTPIRPGLYRFYENPNAIWVIVLRELTNLEVR